MLLLISHDRAIVRFNKLLYSMNALIAANTKYAPMFSTEISFAMLNIGPSLYHQVQLVPKGVMNISLVHEYINEVLRYEHSMSG